MDGEADGTSVGIYEGLAIGVMLGCCCCCCCC